jgi:hypothetical protein
MIRWRAWSALLAITLVPVAAGAQTPRSPYSDLFGRAPSQGSSGEWTSVQLRTTTGAQVGQTLEADFEQHDVVPEGFAAGAEASMIAQYIRSRVQMRGQGRYSYQEFRRTPAFGAPSFDAGGGINFRATTKVSFDAGAQYLRSPFFQLMWLSPQIFGPSVGNGAAILLMKNDSIEGHAGVVAQIGRRSGLSVTGFTRHTTFERQQEHDFSATGGRATYRYQLTRSLGLRAGYSQEQLRLAPEAATDRYVSEVIDAGVDYARSFSMGRRTTFAFATETSMIRPQQGRRHFRMNGNAALERRFLRTWITQIAAVRGTEFVPGFSAPVFSDRGQAGVAGYLTRRLLINGNAQIARGEVGIGEARHFITYAGDTALTFAVTRNIGVFGQYTYYHYQMPPDPLALVTSSALARQAVSVGIKTFVSIIDKDKVARDPR